MDKQSSQIKKPVQKRERQEEKAPLKQDKPVQGGFSGWSQTH